LQFANPNQNPQPHINEDSNRNVQNPQTDIGKELKLRIGSLSQRIKSIVDNPNLHSSDNFHTLLTNLNNLIPHIQKLDGLIEEHYDCQALQNPSPSPADHATLEPTNSHLTQQQPLQSIAQPHARNFL